MKWIEGSSALLVFAAGGEGIMYSRRRIVFAFDVCCAPYEIAESWLLLLLLCTQTVSAEKTRQKDAPVIERTL